MTPAELAGYAVCALVALVVGAALWHVVKVRPLERERERQNDEVGRLRGQVAALAGEQLRVRRWNPVGRGTPTIRP
jgi:type II secretory pathway component PulM